MHPQVSFVVPCYNYGRFVAQAIDSLLCQTHQDIEVIVIDDTSTDETPQVLERYAGDPRIQLIRHEQNIGHIRSYNEGIGLARGEYVGLLSADDFCLRSDAVERQVTCFKQNPTVAFVYSSVAFTDENGCTLWVKRPAIEDPIHDQVRTGLSEFVRLIYENYISHSGTLVRKSCHDELGLYDARLPHAGDWDLWLRLLGRYDVGYIAEPLFGYRIHPNNMHHSKITVREETSNNTLAVVKGFDGLAADAPKSVRRLRQDALQRAWLRAAVVACASGRRRRAWQALTDAATREPWLCTARVFYMTLAKLCLLTVAGPRLYYTLAAQRRARLAAA